jgi:serine acetyltransferase
MQLTSLLWADAQFYLQKSLPDFQPKTLAMLILGAANRDFRLNILVRLNSAKIPLVSKLCNKCIFYMYGCTISPHALFDVPLRFTHARSIVIGGHVCFNPPGSAYLFNNVTIGKLSPRDPSTAMPHFNGHSFFGVGSVVLGNVKTNSNTVFAANSFCSLKDVPSNATVIKYNEIIPHSFLSNESTSAYHGVGIPVLLRLLIAYNNLIMSKCMR